MAKGFLNKLILLVIIVFTGLTVLVAGLYIGYTMVMEGLKTQLNSTTEELKTRAETMANFSAIPSGYSVIKAIDIAGIKMVIASYPYNGQFIGLVDPGWVLDINKKDLTIDQLKTEIDKVLKVINKQDKIKITNFKVERTDAFKAQEQIIPYMRGSVTISGEEVNRYSGIIGIIKNTNINKNYLAISYNDSNKYRQYVADRFFQNIQFKKN